jgi:hypothetical protein
MSPTYAKDVDCELDGQAFASLMRLHELRVPDRLEMVSRILVTHTVIFTHDSRSVDAIAHTSDYPSNDHLRNAIRRRLQHRSDRQDEASQPDTILPTEFLASEQAEQGSCEATDFVDGYYEALERIAAVAGRCVDLGELVGEGCSGEKTTHDTLVCWSVC